VWVVDDTPLFGGQLRRVLWLLGLLGFSIRSVVKVPVCRDGAHVAFVRCVHVASVMTKHVERWQVWL
jgi:hypothetical protein